jgi:hypothetical protein
MACYSQCLMAIMITELWAERLVTLSINVQHFELAPYVNVKHEVVRIQNSSCQ